METYKFKAKLFPLNDDLEVEGRTIFIVANPDDDFLQKATRRAKLAQEIRKVDEDLQSVDFCPLSSPFTVLVASGSHHFLPDEGVEEMVAGIPTLSFCDGHLFIRVHVSLNAVELIEMETDAIPFDALTTLLAGTPLET